MRISRIGLLALVLALFGGIGNAGAATVELVSGATGPVPDSFGMSDLPAWSDDGRYVAFQSAAPNLVPGQEDDNHSADIFLHDRVTGTTTLVSHAAGSPTRAAGGEGSLDISANGRYVAFISRGGNLVPDAVDANGGSDVFLWDRVTGAITLVSHAAGSPGTAADSFSYYVFISADGNFVVFTSRASNLVAGQVEPVPIQQTADVFLWSRASNTLTLLSRKSGTTATAADQDSLATDLSADGGVVVFWTVANDLLSTVADGKGDADIYAYQRSTDTLSLVSRTGDAPQVTAGGALETAVVSADGRYVAFASYADNLVPGQEAGGILNSDAYLFDRTTGEMRLVSRTSASPLQGGGIFGNHTMSADGRYVAFSSGATDLIPGQVDSNEVLDVFVYDRVTGLTSLASHSRGSFLTAGSLGGSGAPSPSGLPSLSADGRFLVFQSLAVDLVPGQTDDPGTLDVFLYDLSSRSVVLMSRTRASAAAAGNGPSYFPVLSADGSMAAFLSQATDLGEGQTDPYGFFDLFLYHRISGEITNPSRRDSSLPPPLTPLHASTLGSLSADGRSVLFQSPLPGSLPPPETGDVFLRDIVADTTTPLRLPPFPEYALGFSQSPVLSADGRFAAFLSGQYPILSPTLLEPLETLHLYDRAARTFTLANHAPGSAPPGSQPDGSPSNFALSADGRYVAYECTACGLVPGHTAGPGFFREIFLYDRLSGLNTLVSRAADTSQPAFRANNQSYRPAISADGRYVVFWSFATNLVPGQIDVPGTQDLFVFDRVTGMTSLVTYTPGFPATAAGLLSAASPLVPADLSADGRFIAFESALPNLVSGQVDSNPGTDIFLHDQFARTTVLVSHAASSPLTTANAPSPSSDQEDDTVSMSADGRFLVYESHATDLVAGASDTNGGRDVFLYDRLTGTTSLVSHVGGDPLKAGNGESEVPRISADGSRIAFLSGAEDLIPGQTVPAAFTGSRSLYVQYRNQNGSAATTTFIAQALRTGRPFNSFPSEEEPLSFAPHISANGRRIAFTSDAALVPGDYNGTWDVYLWDQDGTVEPEGPIPVPPCRLLDTRRRAERPALTSNVRRIVTAQGRCGVPATAKKVVVKVTAFNPSGKGNLRFYTGDVTAAPDAILRFERGMTRTETFTLPLNENGTLTILPFVAGRGTVHTAVEVTAYVN
jgi:Tol biopolymer transport system component